MLGGPQLPGQLTAINKESVVRPAPEAAGAAKSGLPPRRRHRRRRWGGPEQADPRAANCGARSPASSLGARLPSVLCIGTGGSFVFFTIPLGKAPSLCGSRRLEFTNDRKTHERHFGGSLGKALRGMTPVLVLPQVCLPQLLLASSRESGPCHTRPCTLPP